MPYKDPERNRQWEQEHRGERNARRPLTVPYRVHDPPSLRETTAGWTVAAAIGGVMLTVGMVLLAAWRGESRSSTGSS